MKIRFAPVCLLLASMSLIAPQLYAATPTKETDKSGTLESSSSLLSAVSPELLFAYTDFRFNSRRGANFNRFDGHAKQYSIGADKQFGDKSWLLGLYLMRVDTSLQSHVRIGQIMSDSINNKIRNHSVFAHALKKVSGNWYVDVAGAYGRSRLSSNVMIEPTEEHPTFTAFGRSSNNNWLGSLMLIHVRSWSQFTVSAYGRFLYSNVGAGNYSLNFAEPVGLRFVPKTSTRTTWLMEHVDVVYRWSENFLPFVDFGLIQVPHQSNTRPLGLVAIDGVLPQLSVTNSGFRLGTGFSWKYNKRLLGRIQYQYYRAGSVYRSGMTLFKLKYLLD